MSVYWVERTPVSWPCHKFCQLKALYLKKVWQEQELYMKAALYLEIIFWLKILSLQFNLPYVFGYEQIHVARKWNLLRPAGKRFCYKDFHLQIEDAAWKILPIGFGLTVPDCKLQTPKDLQFWIACKNIGDFFSIFLILSRKKMGLGFLFDQIYLVSSGNYDPHAKIRGFSGFFFYRALLGCTSKPQVLYWHQDSKSSNQKKSYVVNYLCIDKQQQQTSLQLVDQSGSPILLI